MRIAIVTAFPEQEDTPRGGVEAVSVTLVQSLAALPAVDVQVVTVRAGATAGTRQWKGATIHTLPRLGKRMLTGAMGADRRQVQEYVRTLKPDVVHAHDTFGLMVRGMPLPRVLTIHGFIHGDTLVAGAAFARVRSAAWRLIESRTWADYPHIISISPYVRERLTGIATGAIHDIDNPIGASFFDVPRRENGLVIFSAAVVSRRKNTLGLIEALARVRKAGVDASLRLAGAVAEPEYDQLVSARIGALDLEPYVVRLGGISAAQVANELSEASVFALVSREENSPLGIEEAMAAGVPVVTSNRCGMPYMVRDGVTGHLVDPENPADIAARLVALLKHPERRAAMGVHARAVASDRFHPSHVAERTRAVYARALEPKAASPRQAQ